jgi:hypothetical protein
MIRPAGGATNNPTTNNLPLVEPSFEAKPVDRLTGLAREP